MQTFTLSTFINIDDCFFQYQEFNFVIFILIKVTVSLNFFRPKLILQENQIMCYEDVILAFINEKNGAILQKENPLHSFYVKQHHAYFHTLQYYEFWTIILLQFIIALHNACNIQGEKNLEFNIFNISSTFLY